MKKKKMTTTARTPVYRALAETLLIIYMIYLSLASMMSGNRRNPVG